MLLEKKTRLAADVKSTIAITNAILNACLQCGNYDILNLQMSLLSKRRAQLQKVIEVVVQWGTKLVMNELKDKEDVQRKLIETLRNVAAGKVSTTLFLSLYLLIYIIYNWPLVYNEGGRPGLIDSIVLWQCLTF